MSTLAETITYRGYDIDIHYDCDVSNPRTEFDNAGTLLFKKSQGVIGRDDIDDTCPDRALMDRAYEEAPEELQDQYHRFNPDDGTVYDQEGTWTQQSIDAAWEKTREAMLTNLRKHLLWAPCSILTNPSYGHVHQADWYVEPQGSYTDALHYMTLKKAIAEWGTKSTTCWEDEVNYGGKRITLLQAAKNCMEAEFETFRQWCVGESYYYLVEGIDESCGGFYGDDHEKSGLLEYAKGAIDHHIRSEREKHFDSLKAKLRHRAPLDKREPFPEELAA